MTVASLRILFFSLQMADVLTTLLAFYLATTHPTAASILLGSIALKVSAILITFRLASESVVNKESGVFRGLDTTDASMYPGRNCVTCTIMRRPRPSTLGIGPRMGHNVLLRNGDIAETGIPIGKSKSTLGDGLRSRYAVSTVARFAC
jgi:hypothetical protein